MSDEVSPAWTSLKASLEPTFPQLQELEVGGALTMDLGSDGWLLELTPDGRLLCQYGMALDDVMTLLSDGTPEDLGMDEIAKQAKYYIQPEVSSVVVSGISQSFDWLSRTPGYVTYVLLTRAPVYSGAEAPFLPRLACVRHAASVRSEPGSNSPVNSGVTKASCTFAFDALL